MCAHLTDRLGRLLVRHLRVLCCPCSSMTLCLPHCTNRVPGPAGMWYAALLLSAELLRRGVVAACSAAMHDRNTFIIVRFLLGAWPAVFFSLPAMP